MKEPINTDFHDGPTTPWGMSFDVVVPEEEFDDITEGRFADEVTVREKLPLKEPVTAPSDPCGIDDLFPLETW